ncbi:hypothetical protein GJAV_G00014920 [Gymnothorax javanicus]|nr:hypothetical protein GJAV_G00014920 [Gymnothorax javanicus]
MAAAPDSRRANVRSGDTQDKHCEGGEASVMPQPSPGQSSDQKPVCLIVLGMAGSGKTTFVQRLTAHLHGKKNPPYVINLDPAVHEVPFPVNIDIRDTVNYKEVMKQYPFESIIKMFTCEDVHGFKSK